VLHEPQDAVNIAATIRAMKNMGVGALHLVRPKTFDPDDVERVAHGTSDIVRRVEIHESLDAALVDCVMVAAYTARRRAAKREVVDARAAATELIGATTGGVVALLFGREDRGLPNEAVDRAQLVVTIPTTGYASLNLAQAVLIALYEMHLSVPEATRRLEGPRKDARPPTDAEREQACADARRALEAMDFFKTRNPEHVLRTLRSLMSRARTDARELSLLRAMAIEVLRTIDRVRAGVA
jgi:tRNA/rRNA methyltransferase/tRNA (cytidine32/uridine32-2'-O)-methyltransferase